MRVATLATLVCSASAVRRTKVQAEQVTRFVGGVPVHELRSLPAPLDQWLVFFKDGGDDAEIEALCGQANLKCNVMGHASKGGVPFVALTGSEEALGAAVSGSHVDFVAPDYAMEPDIDPSPEDVAKAERKAPPPNDNWHLQRVGVPQATETGKGVNVYVLDSGVMTEHSMFENRAYPTLMWKKDSSRVCPTLTSDPEYRECARDYDGHGSHVAGTVGGKGYGVAPDVNIRVMTMYFNRSDRGVSVAFGSFDWLIQHHIKPAVLTMSFGWKGEIIAGAQLAIDKVLAAGITVVTASGNSNKDACGSTFPGMSGLISVAASDSGDNAAGFTNFGECITLYAPGVGIMSAEAWDLPNGVRKMSGTSMAAPMVAGAAALLLEKDPSMTPAQVKAALVNNAEKDSIKRDELKPGTPNLLLKVA